MAKKKLTLEAYADFVTSIVSKHSMKNFKAKLGTAGLGLGGEAGEIADTVKKLLFHGKKYDEETRQHLIKELGDVMWYVSFMARHVLNTTVEEVIELNKAKLEERYKTGKFTTREFLEKEAMKKPVSQEAFKDADQPLRKTIGKKKEKLVTLYSDWK
jgi:NTP pyrophosphatase (non-canonical NTP hydrolase)